jgi:Ca2+-binding EF-hand superfamily protein
MKIYLLVAIAAIALAGCASTVRTARNLNPFTASTSFQHWDVNGNGVISRSEAAKYAPLKNNFNTIDTNGNGVIDQDEYTAATTDLNPCTSFTSYDLNGDGVITEREADAAPKGGLEDHFDDVDADGDGNISRAEFRAAAVNLLGGVPFNKVDTDGDGSISQNEAEANAPLLWQNFGRLDVNDDDQISKQEYQSFQNRRNACNGQRGNNSNNNRNGNNNNNNGNG